MVLLSLVDSLTFLSIMLCAFTDWLQALATGNGVVWWDCQICSMDRTCEAIKLRKMSNCQEVLEGMGQCMLCSSQVGAWRAYSSLVDVPAVGIVSVRMEIPDCLLEPCRYCWGWAHLGKWLAQNPTSPTACYELGLFWKLIESSLPCSPISLEGNTAC